MHWAIDTFRDDLLVTTALGAGGVLLLRYLRDIAPNHPAYLIDTNQLFPQTLEYRDALIRDHGLNIVTAGPDHDEPTFGREHGKQLWTSNPDRCCHLRKVVVQSRLLKGKRATLAALRREQGGARAALPIADTNSTGFTTVYPLALATRDWIDTELASLGIPQHPLRALGFTSVGCVPCTRAIAPGEGERAGRWADSAKTECGLHAHLVTR